MKNIFIFTLLVVFVMNFIVALDVTSIDCTQIKTMISDDIVGIKLPDQVPFTDEILNLHLDDKLIASILLVNKTVSDISCDINRTGTYNVYVASSLFEESYDGEINPINFYNEKKASGQIKIVGIGVSRKVKLGFINIGLKIAGWFGN